MAKITIEFEATIYVCNQRHVYASMDDKATCPHCLQKRLSDTEVWWRNAQDAVAKRDRIISALKGTITKMKKRIK